MNIIQKIEKRLEEHSFSEFENSMSVSKYYLEILKATCDTINVKNALFIWINNKPEFYENKIERIFKIQDSQIEPSFDWWKSEDKEFYPFTKKFISNDSYSQRFRYISKEAFLNEIIENCEDSNRFIVDRIHSNYKNFGEVLLLIPIGSSTEFYGSFILDIDKEVLSNEQVELLSLFLNSLLSSFLLKLYDQRELLLLLFNKELHKLEYWNRYYIESLIEKIASIFKTGTRHLCSEIGIFEKFANRINIIPTNYKSFVDNKKITSKFDKPLIIDSSPNTAIERVAMEKRPYYVESVKNKNKTYNPVEETTLSQFTIPLIWRNNLVGILNIGLNIEYGFLPNDRKILTIIANDIANAIEQRNFFLIHNGISQHFTNRLYHFIEDKTINKKIEKYSNSPEKITKTFFNYIYPIYNDFNNYDNILRYNHDDKVLIDEIIVKSVDIFNNHSYNKNKIKVTIDGSLNKIQIKSNEEYLVGTLISFFSYSAENCIRAIEKKQDKDHLYIFINSKVDVKGELSINIKNNGVMPEATYLSNRFKLVDYPRPLNITTKGARKLIKKSQYLGLPFVFINYFLQKIDASIFIDEENGTNLIGIKFKKFTIL